MCDYLLDRGRCFGCEVGVAPGDALPVEAAFDARVGVGIDVDAPLLRFDDPVLASAVIAGAIRVTGMVDGVCGLSVSGTKTGIMGAGTPMVVAVGVGGGGGGGQAGREIVVAER